MPSLLDRREWVTSAFHGPTEGTSALWPQTELLLGRRLRSRSSGAPDHYRAASIRRASPAQRS
jgi:hypothetical protein